MNMIKKTAITALAIATIAMGALGAGTTDANAGGWKKHKHHGHHKHHSFRLKWGHDYDYGYNNYCKPKYKKIWIWSKHHGHKVKRWVQVGKWCGGHYISLH